MDQLDGVRRRRSQARDARDDRFALARRRLLRQASVFDDPAAYAAGVEDAFAAIDELTNLDEGVRTLDDPSPQPRIVGGLR